MHGVGRANPAEANAVAAELDPAAASDRVAGRVRMDHDRTDRVRAELVPAAASAQVQAPVSRVDRDETRTDSPATPTSVRHTRSRAYPQPFCAAGSPKPQAPALPDAEVVADPAMRSHKTAIAMAIALIRRGRRATTPATRIARADRSPDRPAIRCTSRVRRADLATTTTATTAFANADRNAEALNAKRRV